MPGALAVISTNDQVAAITPLVDTLAGAAGAGPAPSPDLPTVYIDDAGNVWQESNGLPGLQDKPSMEQGKDWPADTFVAGWATLTGAALPGLPL
jgi:hypothetical protein